MSTAWTLFWVLFGFAMFVTYVSVATVVTVVVRKRVMEVTCRKGDRQRYLSSDDHLYCDTLSNHWFGPALSGVLWPLAMVPLLILARLHRDEVSLARIDRM